MKSLRLIRWALRRFWWSIRRTRWLLLFRRKTTSPFSNNQFKFFLYQFYHSDASGPNKLTVWLNRIFSSLVIKWRSFLTWDMCCLDTTSVKNLKSVEQNLMLSSSFRCHVTKFIIFKNKILVTLCCATNVVWCSTNPPLMTLCQHKSWKNEAIA